MIAGGGASTVRQVVIKDERAIVPFAEVARNLPILNKPLWKHQTEAVAKHCSPERVTVSSLEEALLLDGELLVYRDNLFFDSDLVDDFMSRARSKGGPCQIAFATTDRSISEHAIYLQHGLKEEGTSFRAELFWYPSEQRGKAEPIFVDTEPLEMWYLAVPTKDHLMRNGIVTRYEIPTEIAFSPLRLFIPLKRFVSIESWVHLLFANLIWGLHARAHKVQRQMSRLRSRLSLYAQALLELKSPLSSSAVVHIGSNCQIDPTALILGPTVIGNDVIVGPRTVVAACDIGNDVTIGQGCQLWLSVIGSGCVLPFRVDVLMSCLMQRVILNSPVRFSIIGEDTFVGAGVWFTDRSLRGKEILDPRLGGEMVKTFHEGALGPSGHFVLGSAIGPNVRIATGHIIYPGRIIGPGSSLIDLENSGRTYRVVARNIGVDDG